MDPRAAEGQARERQTPCGHVMGWRVELRVPGLQLGLGLGLGLGSGLDGAWSVRIPYLDAVQQASQRLPNGEVVCRSPVAATREGELGERRQPRGHVGQSRHQGSEEGRGVEGQRVLVAAAHPVEPFSLELPTDLPFGLGLGLGLGLGPLKLRIDLEAVAEWFVGDGELLEAHPPNVGFDRIAHERHLG